MKKFKILSTFFIIILGTILHFTYEWSNNNQIVGAFSAVNESTWEHLKLLFFPMLITTIVGYFYFGKRVPNFLCGKVLEVITSMVFTIVVYYTYTGVLGSDIAFVNILIFILAAIVGELVNYAIIISGFLCNKKAAIGVLVILGMMFVYFTYNAPEIEIFKDPITGGYGISSENWGGRFERVVPGMVQLYFYIYKSGFVIEWIKEKAYERDWEMNIRDYGFKEEKYANWSRILY